MRPVLRIGTRGSALALVQSRGIQAVLGIPSELVILKTTGDQNPEARLDLVGGVGLFTKELERALLAHEVDLAVHSLKDLPVEQPPGLVLGTMPARAPAADLLLIRPDALDTDLEVPVKSGATLGTSSSRRRALAEHYRPDLEAVNLRGNVPTRLKKCIAGECDALVLAQAGLQRLGADLSPLLAFELNPSRWPCAPGQGALGLELRQEDVGAWPRLTRLEDPATRACVEAERHLLQVSGGGCHSAFGAWAHLHQGGASIHVALSDEIHGFRLSHFSATKLPLAVETAAQWVGQGAPPVPHPPRDQEDWLCRPAPARS